MRAEIGMGEQHEIYRQLSGLDIDIFRTYIDQWNFKGNSLYNSFLLKLDKIKQILPLHFLKPPIASPTDKDASPGSSAGSPVSASSHRSASSAGDDGLNQPRAGGYRIFDKPQQQMQDTDAANLPPVLKLTIVVDPHTPVP
jgi:hypothetical protein